MAAEQPSGEPVAGTGLAWKTLFFHALALVLVQGTFSALQFTLPVVARKQLDAAPLQVTLITAAPLVLAVLSIFWHAIQERLSLRTNMAVYWACASLPLIPMSFATTYWPFAVCWLFCAIGSSAWVPIGGEMLRKFYPAARRGTVYGLITVASMSGGAIASWNMGSWLEHDPAALKHILWVAVVAQGAGAVIVVLLGGWGQVARQEATRPSFASLVRPIFHAGEVLRQDKLFGRYEAAFMTYGIGWMICYALVPLILVDRLHLGYEDAANNSHVIFLICLVAATLPAGALMDKIGPARTCSFAFLFYVLYPLGLVFAQTKGHIAAASVIYGVSAAAVNAGWMLGPVALAPSPDKVPQYVAIHTTMVGLRGALFQFLGIGIYTLTQSFTPALILAAGGFLWAAYQMWAITGLVNERLRKR